MTAAMAVDITTGRLAHQVVTVETRLPTPNTREHPMVRSKRVREQRRVVRHALERLAVRPRLRPGQRLRVTLIRIGSPRCDTDRANISLAAVRDEVARWAFDVPFEAINAKGKRYAPRAPDGPNDRIDWLYGPHEKAPKGMRKYQAARIIIEQP